MANLIRLKQIEGSAQLEAAISAGNAISESGGNFADAINNTISQSLQSSLSASIINIITNNVAATLPDGVVSSSAQIYITGTIGYNDIATDIEVAVVSSSISTSLSLISSSIASVTGDFSSSVSTSLNLLSSSLNAFTSSIGLTIKQKLNTENVITSSRQLDGSLINNLTLGTTGDAYSLIVSGALAVVDADITISGSQYNVGGQIWVNGQTGSAGNPPAQPYDNNGNAQSDIIDQGEW